MAPPKILLIDAELNVHVISSEIMLLVFSMDCSLGTRPVGLCMLAVPQCDRLPIKSYFWMKRNEIIMGVFIQGL